MKLYVLLVVVASLTSITMAQSTKPAGLSNPFYAMDTSFQRPGLTQAEQFDLVKELGYAGIAWHDAPADKSKADAVEAEKRGLKMFTIYCAATVKDGDITWSAQMPKLMEALKPHGTIIWLHIGGKGPDIAKLTADDPIVKKLRDLAETAAANDLRIAIYPHLGEWTAHFGDATTLAKLVKHPRFGVTFNLCHCLAAGDEQKIPALLEEAKDVLVTVTVSGADAGVKGGDWGKLIQTLDKGTYDVGIVLRKLKEIGFSGPIGFQGYAIKGDARAILTPTMAAWKKMAGGEK